MAEALRVWMNGQPVGIWSTTRGAVHTFQYEESWRRSAYGRPLSLSLPVSAEGMLRGPAVESYFDNLLPDSTNIRRRIRARFKTRSTDAIDLLAAIGRDCVGAVQLLPPDATPHGWDRIASETLTDTDVEQLLARISSAEIPGTAMDEADGFRISLAGAQEKTALLRYGGRWHRPLGSTPTTHILKLPLGLVGNMRANMAQSVENEWLCAQLLGAIGLPTASTEMHTFGKQKALVVQRFDRRWNSVIDSTVIHTPGFVPPAAAAILRLPQEDFCQAHGLAPTLKYQADGGPGISQCLRLLSASANASQDQKHFALAQLAFWLLAATDGHAKNFSIALHAGGHYTMTPFYDILSAWPVIGRGANQIPEQKAKLAMAVRGSHLHYRLREIQPRHWQTLAQACIASDVWDAMQTMVDGMEGTLERVARQLPRDFPEGIWNSVAAGIRKQVAYFRSASDT